MAATKSVSASLSRLLEQSVLVQEAVMMEPVLLDLLLDAAATPPPAGYTRWHAYRDLKRTCSPYVGYHARRDALATSAHWEALIAVLDALLPDDDRLYSEMDEDEEGSEQ